MVIIGTGEAVYTMYYNIPLSDLTHECLNKYIQQSACMQCHNKFMFVLCYRFNLIAYSTSVHPWQQDLVSLSQESISDSLQWLKEIKAEGNSYLLQSFKVSTCNIFLWFHLYSGRFGTLTINPLHNYAEQGKCRQKIFTYIAGDGLLGIADDGLFLY